MGVEGTPLRVCGVAKVEIMFAGEVFHSPVLVASMLTSEAILGLDFLEANKCSLGMADRTLTFPERGISISLCDTLPDGELVQARVTVDETVRIPPFTVIEVEAQVKGNVRGKAWIVQGCKSKQLSVNVANGLVSGKTSRVPVRLLNPSPDPMTVFKGTKVATVEEVEIGNHSVQAKEEAVSPQKRQLLNDLVERCADGVTGIQRNQLLQLLLEFGDIFAEDGGLGRTNRIQHNIDTGDAHPIRQPVRRLPLNQRVEVKDLLADMEKKGVIQPSHSPWASPIVLVKKRDGSHRFCVDYRKLNAVTRKDAYPIPRIDDTLDTLSGSCWFSTLDMVSGYWQVEVDERDREKTAFCTPYGLYEFNVMPFGLCNGPATFQRLMDLVLAGLQMTHCLVYIDDVIVVGRTFEEHLCNLREVLSRVKEAGLKLKLSKCALLQDKVTYLGHEVSPSGVAPDPNKISQVASWPVPQSVKDVQKFWGLASYYRWFVRDFATIAKPLHRLTEKNSTFEWSVECQEAFVTLRRCLCTAPVLAFPRFDQPFLLDTDASNSGIGGVLSQLDDEGVEHVVAFASRTLSKSERRYCVTRRELLAVVVFTQHFRPYLLGREFTLRTDHGSLSWLQSFREPEGQLARWLEKLQEYNFRVVHRPGKKHGNADALSRRPCDQCGRTDQEQQPVEVETLKLLSGEESTPSHLRQLQKEDPEIKFILDAWESGQRPAGDEVKSKGPVVRKLVQIWDQLTVTEGVLIRKYEADERPQCYSQWIVPRHKRKEILHQLHGGPLGGHLGESKTLHKLKERFYWPGHATDVRDWCRNCDLCAQRKMPKPRAPLVSLQVGSPMQLVATDIVGPLPVSTSGNSYILVAADYFTRWVEAYPISCQDAQVVAKKLVDEIFCRFSPPEQLHSDQGRQFESLLISEVCTLLGIDKSRTTAYHPQSDGLVERWNRTLLQSLATMVKDHPEDWDECVRRVCMAYNTSLHPTTGFTPFYLMFGRQARLPVELMYGSPERAEMPQSQYAAGLKTSLEEAYEQVRENTSRALKRQKDFYNKKVHGHHYQVGDYVWVLFPQPPRGKSRKLYRPWSGPFRVVKKLSDVNYRVQECNNRRRRMVIHFNRLKPYKGDVTSYQRETRRHSLPIHTGTEATRQEPHYFGTDLEIVEDDEHLSPTTIPIETGEEQVRDARQGVDTPSSNCRRYPQRVRRPPQTFSGEFHTC